jgi:hypothetical protein
MAEEGIDAVDIFDWDYLVQIGMYLDRDEVKTLYQAVQVFAYAFTSTSDTESQNSRLAEWIQNATYLQSPETAEEILRALARSSHANLDLLRKFAKEHGVRLKR